MSAPVLRQPGRSLLEDDLAIHIPQSDLARATVHAPDQDWPGEVKVQLVWLVNGQPRIRTVVIDADHFFGRGHGAPMSGDLLLGTINNLRREGPPQLPAKNRFIPKDKPRAVKKRR